MELSCNESPPIATEYNTANTAVMPHRSANGLARFTVPQASHPVPAGCRHELSVRAENGIPHVVFMPQRYANG
jgi:hypothetical protein